MKTHCEKYLTAVKNGKSWPWNCMENKHFQNVEQSKAIALTMVFTVIVLYTNIAIANTCMKAFSPISISIQDSFSSDFIVVSGPPPTKPLSVKSHKNRTLSWSEANRAMVRNQFRRAFNIGKFTEDDIYIVAPSESGSNSPPGQYAKVVQMTERSVVVEREDFFGNIFKETLTRKSLKQAKVDSDVKNFFKSLESKVEEVGPFEAPKTNEEGRLKAQGWRKVFLIGLDLIGALKYLGQKLREARIHPYKTHVVDFARLAKSYIDYIKQGIKEQNIEVAERLQLLEQIWQEVQTKIKEKKMSYAYWLFLNYRLSMLATPSKERKVPPGSDWWTTEEKLFTYFKNYPNKKQKYNINVDNMSFQKRSETLVNWVNQQYHHSLFIQIVGLIHLFPSRIILPSIHPVGIKGINRALSNGIFAATLANKKQRYDSEDMTPIRSFTHDIEHALLSLQLMERFIDSYNMTLDQFYNALENRELPIEEQERMETVYFTIGHEVEGLPFPINKVEIWFNIEMFYLSSFYQKDAMGSVLPEHIDSKSQIKSYLSESVDLFSRISDEIRREFQNSNIYPKASNY